MFFALWRRDPAEKYLFHWALSSWIYAFVLVSLFAAQGHHLLLGTLLFALMGLTDILIVSGVYRLNGEPPFRRWMIIPVLAAPLGHSLPVIFGISDHSPLAEASEALGLAVAMGLSGLAVFRARSAIPASRGQRIAGLALLAYLPGYMAVVIISLWFPQ